MLENLLAQSNTTNAQLQASLKESTAQLEHADQRSSGSWPNASAYKAPSMPSPEQAFFNSPLLLLEDAAHSRQEPRFHALGKTDEGRTLHITFTLRQSSRLIRVISARDMHRKERVIYEQAD